MNYHSGKIRNDHLPNFHSTPDWFCSVPIPAIEVFKFTNFIAFSQGFSS